MGQDEVCFSPIHVVGKGVINLNQNIFELLSDLEDIIYFLEKNPRLSNEDYRRLNRMTSLQQELCDYLEEEYLPAWENGDRYYV